MTILLCCDDFNTLFNSDFDLFLLIIEACSALRSVYYNLQTFECVTVEAYINTIQYYIGSFLKDDIILRLFLMYKLNYDSFYFWSSVSKAI